MNIQKLFNTNPANIVGFTNYYFKYFSLKLFRNKNLAQRIFEEFTENIIKQDGINSKNMSSVISMFKICLKNGAKINLPKLKVKANIFNHLNDDFFNFKNKEIIDNVDVYDFLISSPDVDIKDKCQLDSILLQSMMADLILLSYNKNINYFSKYVEQKATSSNALNAHYSALTEVENILFRGFVFDNQLSRFLVLSSVFNYREIFDNLSMKFKLICYQEFSRLTSVGKKALTALLIKNKNEEAIFNLLNYGLKLHWDIPIEDGKKNLVAFEMLHSLNWVKAIIDHNGLDIRQTNSRGENILHLIGVCALDDPSIEIALRRRINELTVDEKNHLFFQLNEEHLTPLMKAVIFQDEKLIEFIQEFNIKPWDKLEGAPFHESALDFLNNHVLTHTEEGSLGSLMDYFKDSFWMGLAKKWNSEYYYLKLQKELSNNGQRKKSLKI